MNILENIYNANVRDNEISIFGGFNEDEEPIYFYTKKDDLTTNCFVFSKYISPFFIKREDQEYKTYSMNKMDHIDEVELCKKIDNLISFHNYELDYLNNNEVINFILGIANSSIIGATITIENYAIKDPIICKSFPVTNFSKHKMQQVEVFIKDSGKTASFLVNKTVQKVIFAYMSSINEDFDLNNPRSLSKHFIIDKNISHIEKEICRILKAK